MRTTNTLLATLKESPADAELASHKLMLRAGLIRQVASGIYMWLPTGQRVLNKVTQIVQEEMNASGAQQLTMPHLCPAGLWEESGRWQQYGPELLRITDRHDREFCFGPTHEETFSFLARSEIKSYRQLPQTLYQVQTKFRDEIRPRFGVMRAREFVMKDAYSFHTTSECLKKEYQNMRQAYCRIFDRLGLDYRVVQADSGAIGGELSEEFQVIAGSGEDKIFYSDGSDYAANVEKASALEPAKAVEPTQELVAFDTPDAKTIDDLVNKHGINACETVKTLIMKNHEEQFFAVILRGDHKLNEIKLSKNTDIGQWQFANAEEVANAMGANKGSLGPVNCPISIIVDRDAAALSDFSCGANINGQHFKGANWERDVKEFTVADIRNVVEGDTSPDGNGTLKQTRGIEVGHIFQIDDKYTKPMDITVLNDNGKAVNPLMGCYGLGVTRVIAAAIEQHHDDRGILWPTAMAPFTIALIPMKYEQSDAVKVKTDELYDAFKNAGIDVLLDDRNERPGVKFADTDLIGIPHRIVISDRGLENNQLEYKARSESDAVMIAQEEAIDLLLRKLDDERNNTQIH